MSKADNTKKNLIDDTNIEMILKRYPRIASLIRDERYPLAPDGRLRVDPTHRDDIRVLYSIRVDLPTQVWNDKPPQMVTQEVLAARQNPIMPTREGLAWWLHCEQYPIEEGKFAALFTENELPAIRALLLDRYPGATNISFIAHSVPVSRPISMNYACQWGGYLRMNQLKQNIFDFGSMDLYLFFDARNSLSDEELDELHNSWIEKCRPTEDDGDFPF